VYTSPLERAVETAEPIARRHELEARIVEELGEVRFGEWEGLHFEELAGRADWRAFHEFRTGTRPPGGELMMETQLRMVRQFELLGDRHPDETIAIVSHGDPLRLLVAWCLGLSTDLLLRFELSPGSVSIAQKWAHGCRMLCINRMEELPL
jgi:probable phosphoglycerate mutase